MNRHVSGQVQALETGIIRKIQTRPSVFQEMLHMARTGVGADQVSCQSPVPGAENPADLDAPLLVRISKCGK